MTAVEVPAPYMVDKVNAPVVSRGKAGGALGLRAGILGVGVQVVSSDMGETNLHSHPATDSVWFVLGGEAEFYGTDDDVLIGRIGKNEGIAIPAGSPYWFKCSSDENLVIMHITARTPDYKEGASRKDYKPRDVGGEHRIRELVPGAFWQG
jgi:mannose-6-phosphate isomerase-like protein (cupin superfamily)